MTFSIPEIQVGSPQRHEALAVFPLFAGDKTGAEYGDKTGAEYDDKTGAEYLLSDEALATGSLTVKEVDEAGSVPDLLVENKGDVRVLFIEGEELVGAKQNRILNTSVLVAAHSKTKVPVSCVEQGRWRYKSRWFGSSGSHSPSKLRYALKASVSESAKSCGAHRSDQGRVWKEVERQQMALRATSASMAMSDTFALHQDQLADFRKSLNYIEGAIGLAIAIGKEVVSLDVFDKASTCEKMWDRLLSGYVLDALEAGAASEQEAQAADVVQLLTGSNQARWERVDAVGDGDEYRAEFQGEHGSALTLNDTLIHGSVMALA